MIRSLLAVVAFALAVPLFAQPPKAPEPKLKIGDPAPTLVVDKWLTGKEVKEFEKDTVYVLNLLPVSDADFPAAMAALSDLSDKSGGKGLVVVGMQSPNYGPLEWDDKKLEKELASHTASTKQSGASYPVGWEKARKTWDAYVGKGKPAVFVVDKAGKIAYVGYAPTAAYVAAKVLDGSWKGKADMDAMAETEAKLGKFMEELGKKIGQPDKLDDKAIKTLQGELPALEKMFKDSPFLLTTEQGWEMRFAVHLFAQSYEVPEEMIGAMVATAQKRKNKRVLDRLGYMLASVPLKPDPKFSKLVAKFTDAYAGLFDPKKAATDDYLDWTGMIIMSKKHGNTEKADAYTKVILDATPADKKKEMEEAIKRRLKDAGVDK